MKQIIILVPKGYDAIEIEVPDELTHLLKAKAVRMINFSSSNSTIIIDKVSMPRSTN